VLPSSDTYAIWWGPASAWASDVEPGIGTLFGGLNGTSFLNTGTQYMRGAGIGSSFKGSVSDPSTPPKKVSASTLGQEVAKMYGSSLDPSGIYFVFTSNFPRGGGFCAWHSFTSVNGQSIAVAYMPNTTNVSGCDPGNLYNLSGSEGLRSLANVTSHEFMEAITDTLPANGSYGWIDSSGSEIGDKCAWTFNGAVTLSNGSTWQLQQEWSNAAGGCVQTT
jgi:serine protease